MAKIGTLTGADAAWMAVGGATVSGGTITVPMTSGFTAGAATNATYDLTASQLTVQVAPSDTTAESFFFLTADQFAAGNNAVGWSIVSNTLYAHRRVGGSAAAVASVAYNAATHKFFRIREASGVVYWDHSPDGTTWTNFASWTVSGLNLTAFYLLLGNGGAATGTTAFSNINSVAAPTPTPPTVPGQVGGEYLRTTSGGTQVFKYEVRPDPGVTGDAGQVFLYMPGGKVPGSAAKCVIVAHGYGNHGYDFMDVGGAGTSSAAVQPTVDAFMDAGYIMLVPEMGETFGNADAMARLTRANSYAVSNWTVAGTVLLGFSMGGGAAAVALHRRPFPIRAAHLVAPLLDWTAGANAGDTSVGAQAIRAAYGATAATFAAATASFAPIRQPGGLFTGVRVRAASSPGDATVSRTANALAWLTAITGKAAQAVDVQVTGDHNDVSQWANPAGTVAWLDAAITSGYLPMRVRDRWTGSTLARLRSGRWTGSALATQITKT